MPVRGRGGLAGPEGAFDVVLLLETLLAFPDQQTLLREVGTALAPGGRFAFTLEEGRPLIDAFVAEQSAIVAELGRGALDDLLAAHRLWSDWMTTGRVRKFVVAVKADGRRARR